jgi:hypothetical protein
MVSCFKYIFLYVWWAASRAVVVWLHNKIFYQVMGREKLFKGVKKNLK